MPTIPLVLTTDRFLLSPLEGEADLALLRGWLADIRVSTGLVRPSFDVSMAELEGLTRAYDGRSALLLAIRSKDTGSAIGFYTLHSARASRSLWLSVVIGERSALGQDVVQETGNILLNWVFDHARFETVEARVAEGNRLMVRVLDQWLASRCTSVVEPIEKNSAGEQVTTLRYQVRKIDWCHDHSERRIVKSTRSEEQRS